MMKSDLDSKFQKLEKILFRPNNFGIKTINLLWSLEKECKKKNFLNLGDRMH